MKERDDNNSGLNVKIEELEKRLAYMEEEKRVREKEILELQYQLQVFRSSRRYKYAEYLGMIYKKPSMIFPLTIKCGKKAVKKSLNKFRMNHTGKRLEQKEMRFIQDEIEINYNKNPKLKTKSVAVVVCVHDALEAVQKCFISLQENRTFPYTVIIVDDGSDKKTRYYLDEYSKKYKCRLIRNEKAKGYTCAANQGLKAADAEYVVLLNSDTLVTQRWIEKMLACFEKYPLTGMVSPLSNAASYQSVPVVRDMERGDWMINRLEDGMTLEMMSWIVECASKGIYPSVKSLNGFCLMIKRAVIDTIGYLDESSFPVGYGEEVDYCIRAGQNGFELRIADNVYIFHEKSKSFTHKRRHNLGIDSVEILKKKHGNEVYSEIVYAMEECEELASVRSNISVQKEEMQKQSSWLKSKRIAFLVTAAGGSGGVNSIAQEVVGLRKFGFDVNIINSSNYYETFKANYPELAPYTKYFLPKSDKSLIKMAKNFDIVIASIFTTMKLAQVIAENCPQVKVGYYIQDYEPFFFREGEENFKEAEESYTLMKDVCMFAKTKWIADTVKERHDVQVNLVEPSIDTRLYNANIIKYRKKGEPFCICAMIRPKTERRNPKGTLELFRLLKQKYAENIRIIIFGCIDKELEQFKNILDFEYENYGILKRWEVVELFLQSDMFVDMSAYQAFGRSGLESMCTGCIPVVPQNGGADKYAVDGKNAIIADTSDVLGTYRKIIEVLENNNLYFSMQKEALFTGMGYNVCKAAWSEVKVLNSFFDKK